MKTPPSNIPPVPEGFEYFGEGSLLFHPDHPSADIARIIEDWDSWDEGPWKGTLGYGHWALRIGSEIHRKNMPKPEPESYWWPLWKHMSESHGLTLLDDECVQIARAVDEVRAKDADWLAKVNASLAEEIAALKEHRAALSELMNDIADALGLPTGHSHEDVVAGVRNLSAAFDVAKAALEIVRKERDEKAEQLQIALKENKMLSNAIRNSANVEANLRNL